MITHILDTDIVSLHREGHEPTTGRIASAPPGTVATSVLTVEEVLTGWYTLVRRAARPPEIEFAYDKLARSVLFLARIPVVGFSQPAIARYERLKKLKTGVRGKDLRIAAIALEHDATVVTRNLVDFTRVPNLRVEDWSAPSAP